MAKYKVDKKEFERRQLEEQLKQIEMQSKYLKDEPLRRSEVDEYNKLKANDWVKNTLISIGVLSATAVAIVIFVLLGNMLVTKGRTGNVGRHDISGSALYESFKEDASFPSVSLTKEAGDKVVTYKVPKSYIDDKGTVDTSDDVRYDFLKDSSHDVKVTYVLKWSATLEEDGTWISGKGEWVARRVADDRGGYVLGMLLQDGGKDNAKYAIDVKQVDLNTLMTGFFKGQSDGSWAKVLVQDFFYTAWPLTLVFWMVFLLAIVGYAVVLVVGIRYVIRTVIIALRKAGYIASDFVTEVVETVKSEIPLIEADRPEELDFAKIKKQISDKMESEKSKFVAAEVEVVEVPVKKPAKAIAPVAPKAEEVQVEEAQPETKKAPGKSVEDKMNDIFE